MKLSNNDAVAGSFRLFIIIKNIYIKSPELMRTIFRGHPKLYLIFAIYLVSQVNDVERRRLR